MGLGHSRQAMGLQTFLRFMELREVITGFCLGLATIAASPAYAQQPKAARFLWLTMLK